MDKDFWQERWNEGRIGFHKTEVNALLRTYAPQVFGAGRRVLVPMAGKTHDIDWLLQEGYGVVACEFVPAAVESFFEERGISDYHIERQGPEGPGGELDIYTSGVLTFIRGDYFKLPELFSAQPSLQCTAAYDRAAMIACNPEQRKVYVNCLQQLMRSDSPVLLIALEYDQQEYDGPPFSLSEAQLRAAVNEGAVRCLSEKDVLGDYERFAAGGMRRLKECVYSFNTL